MKTLTVTFHHTTNYGAVLQTYALQHTIISMGHENLVFEYKTGGKKKKKKFTIRNLYLSYVSWLRKKEFQNLVQSFADFHRERMMLTRAYCSMDDLRNETPEVDCLITGSDQVWKFSTTPRLLDARLLKFGSDSATRFSYAASMEETNYTEDQKKYLEDALSNFKGISVRERSAKDYIESFTDYKVERVLDPVFLLSKEEWSEIAKEPRIKTPCILCYQVQSNKRMAKVAYQLKKETGYPVVSICNSPIRWMKSDYSFHDVSIEEFLGFYMNAAYIVSASFHGVAMGLVFDKPVYAMVKQERANRIKEIMQLHELDRFIVKQNEVGKVPLYDKSDLERMKLIKEKNIIASQGFLHRMLNQ